MALECGGKRLLRYHYQVFLQIFSEFIANSNFIANPLKPLTPLITKEIGNVLLIVLTAELLEDFVAYVNSFKKHANP